MSEPNLQISVRLTEEEMLKFQQRALLRNNPSQKMGANILLVLICVPFIPLVPFLLSRKAPSQEAIFATCILLAIGVLALIEFKRYSKKFNARWTSSPEFRRHLETKIVDVSPEGIRIEVGTHGEWHDWSLVEEVDRHEKCVYLWLGHTHAHVLPERCFENEPAVERFVDTVKKFLEARPATHATCAKCGYDLRGDSRAGCPECGWERRETQAT